ncbi:hypothetical protein H4217_005969 [Coemansia sp. RSA 1939]|nr:hypothetical protein H4217_005969 [Coemansia sp. RSA 1939]
MLSIVAGTPQKDGPRPEKFDDTWYVELSKSYEDFCKRSNMEFLFRILGDDWSVAWKSFSSNKLLAGSAVIGKIMQSYCNGCKDISRELGNFKRTSENTLQTAFGVLAEAVQDHMDSMRSTNPRIYWRDTHTTNIKRGDGTCRKPDRSFLTTSDSSPEWRNMVAAVEIKGGDMTSDHHHLRGQILQNFIDMAELQPRRFMIGLSLAGNRDIRLYVCVPGGIYYTLLGRLPRVVPTSSLLTPNETCVITFLLFLHSQLGKDCGYLTRRNPGLPGEFSLADIMGIEHVESKLPLQTTIYLDYADENDKVFGRHRHLNGQRTWAYPAQYWNDEHANGQISDAFFKFQWGFDDEVEIEVHRHVLHRKVPHVPPLLYAASVVGNGTGPKSQRYRGEAIVTENVGQSVKSIFKDGGLCVLDATLIDIFAGYVHTLLAAAAVAENKFALHRDISAGNLMVKHDRDPYIIDWGCGRVCAANEVRSQSNKHMIGTTIYMGIRILHGCTSRSVIDDLESLFLVLCHCLWRSFGEKSGHYKTLWSITRLDPVKIARMAWLANSANLLYCMNLSTQLPESLSALAKGMFELLFPDKLVFSTIKPGDVDPRIDAFDQQMWIEVFDKASRLTATGGARMPHLKALRAYVGKGSMRRISSIIEETIQTQQLDDTCEENPSDNADYGSVMPRGQAHHGDSLHTQTPTRSGSKRSPDDLVQRLGNKKPRK